MIKKTLFSILLAAIVTNCGTQANSSALKNSIIAKHYVKSFPYKGHFKVGAPYTINNKQYTPKRDEKYNEVGIASWYGEGDGFHGKLTANGDVFDRAALTAAHKTLPLPCMAKITNLENGKSLVVMINDRGPYAKDRILDLSARAASLLEMKNQGHAKVRVQYLAQETEVLLAELSLKNSQQSKYAKKANDKKNYIPRQLNLENSTNLAKASKSEHFIQLGVYEDKKHAKQLAKAALIFGNSFVETAENDKGNKIYKVKIGPYLEKETALRIVSELKGHDLKGLLVATN